MKKAILTLSVFLVTLLGLNSYGQVVAGQGDGPVLEVNKDTHDYGNIEYGANGTCVFKITNTGNAPLIISLCKGSCGCTVPECPKQPIAPGATAEITVKYDTKRPGPFHKSVTITSNAVNSPSMVIKIKGTVGDKPASETTTPPVN